MRSTNGHASLSLTNFSDTNSWDGPSMTGKPEWFFNSFCVSAYRKTLRCEEVPLLDELSACSISSKYCSSDINRDSTYSRHLPIRLARVLFATDRAVRFCKSL